MRILIADDNGISRKLLSKALRPSGECVFACTGPEALDAYTAAFVSGEPFDVIILDILMPGMDGLEVLKRIREDETDHGVICSDRVKIAMATRLDDKDSVMTAFRDQADGYITKPYGPSTLMVDLRRLGIM